MHSQYIDCDHETYLSHYEKGRNTLLFADFERGDLICTRCGLVLDRVYGCKGTVNEEDEKEEKRRRREKDSLSLYCSQLGIDNDYMLNRILKRFDEIYTNQKTLQKNSFKKCIAQAYAITQILHEEGVPRPPKYISDLFQANGKKWVTHSFIEQPLLYLKNKNDEKVISESVYDDICSKRAIIADDLVEILCDFLHVPFRLRKNIHMFVLQKQYSNYLCPPDCLVASIIIHVFRKERGILDDSFIQNIASQVGGSVAYLRNIEMNLFPRYPWRKYHRKTIFKKRTRQEQATNFIFEIIQKKKSQSSLS